MVAENNNTALLINISVVLRSGSQTNWLVGLGNLVHAQLFVLLPVVSFKTQPLISCQAGRQDREKFSSKKATKKRLNEFASSTNKVSKVLAFNKGLVLVNEGNFLALLKAST